MQRALIGLVLIIAIVFPADAQQNSESGNAMIDACRIVASGNVPAPDHALQAGTCLGELDALNWIAPVMGSDVIRACIPTTTSRQELAKVVVDYLDQNADRLRESFQGLALEALAGRWPCAKHVGLPERLLDRFGLLNE
jgi:hypothetical protein